jgi:protoporphyrinogen IX oxidase
MYEWIKALHVVAIISWMAGLLYLPRLYVYHVAAAPGSEQSETFKVMERRLYRAIMTPAMGWMHGKLALVLALTATHGLMGRWRRDFAGDRNARPSKFFRIWNEVPTLLMVVIVILVVVKPF